MLSSDFSHSEVQGAVLGVDSWFLNPVGTMIGTQAQAQLREVGEEAGKKFLKLLLKFVDSF